MKTSVLAMLLAGVTTALVLATALSTAALAAGPPDPAAPLEEIVVTAEKTSQPLNKVPISLSVLSAAALDAQHITDFADLARAIPNLSFSSGGGPGQSNIEIRGVSSQAGSATTGIYLDEVPINILNIYTAGATEPRFFDIDRVEVLRGPQGTLYGASSMGGTLHFVSNQPDLAKSSGQVHSSAGGTQHGGFDYEEDAVANLPLVEGALGLRVGALYDHQSGWIDRVNPNPGGASVTNVIARHINDVDTTVLRATLEWRPLAGVAVTPALFLQRVRTGGQDIFGADLPRFESPTRVAEAGRDEIAISSLTVKADLGFADLTSVSGFFWRRDDRNIDGTVYDSAYIGGALQEQYGFGGDAVSALAAPAKFNTRVNQVHQELRLASRPGSEADAWSWLVGLYYSRTRTGLLDDEHIPGFNSTIASVYGGTPLDIVGADFPGDLVYHAFSEFVNTQTAAFGQVTFQPLPGLKFTAGARYEKASESLAFDSAGYFASGAPFSGTASGHALTPKGVVSYELSPATMLYASAAEGFRDGGINRPVPLDLCGGDLAALGLARTPPAYRSDKLWSYELGLKTRGFDGRTALTGAVYDIRWNDIQTDIVLPTCTFDIKDNIGSAESRGVEFTLDQRLTEHVSASVGGNYTQAKIVDPVVLLGVARGDRVPGVPDYSVSTALDYAREFGAGGLARARLNAQWIGTSQGTILHGDPDFERPAYLVLGGSIGARWSGIDLSLYVTNLLGQDKVIQRPNVAGVEYGLTVRPRTVGLAGAYSF